MSDSFDDIYNELSLTDSKSKNEEELMLIISERVSYLLDHDLDLLLSYLYRLDIQESEINKALEFAGQVAPHLGIARLILERQKQRVETKKKYRQNPITGWEY